MAKITITIEDTSDEQQKVAFEFDPPTQKGVPLTPAQELAMALAHGLALDANEGKINGEPV